MILVLYQIETTVDKRTTDPRVMRLQYSVWKIRATAIFIKTTEVRVIKSPLRHVPRTLLVPTLGICGDSPGNCDICERQFLNQSNLSVVGLPGAPS